MTSREKPLLGRALTREEVRTFTATARRLAALQTLLPALDTSYRACSAGRGTTNAHPTHPALRTPLRGRG